MVSVKIDRGTATITVDIEGAEYIADVMAEEASRSRDKGAADISEVIYKELEKLKETEE